MKRENNLMAKIADPDNLRLAFWKAAKGKTGKKTVEDYRNNLGENLKNLRESLINGNVSIGDYHYFTIYDPKERLICAASFSERVLHHALMNVCHPNFEKFQIDNSFASRIGKGTCKALEKAYIYQKKYVWFLKLDVRKYFDSINHVVLKQLLASRFKEKPLFALWTKIIDSYKTESSKGLPIGNLTSQYFANHYLGIADHYAKEVLQIPAYVRYMDDMVIWANDKKELLEWGKKFDAFIARELKLELKPFCLNACKKGLPFLGYRIYPHHIRLATKSKKRFVAKVKRYTYYLNEGLWSQSVYQQHILPLLSFVGYADSYALKCKLMDTLKIKG